MTPGSGSQAVWLVEDEPDPALSWACPCSGPRHSPRTQGPPTPWRVCWTCRGDPGAPCDCPLPTPPHTWRPSALRPGRGRSRDRAPWAPWNSQPAPRTQAPRPRSTCSLHGPVPLGGERRVPPGTQPRAGRPSLEAPAPRSRRPAAVSVRAGPPRGSPGGRGSDSAAWGQAACAAGVSGAAPPATPRGAVAALQAPRRAPCQDTARTVWNVLEDGARQRKGLARLLLTSP